MTDTTMTDTTPWEEYCEASRDLSNQEDVGDPWEEYCEASRDLSNQEDVGDPEEKTSDLG